MPFEGSLADRPCKLCDEAYCRHDIKIKDLSFEFDRIWEKYLYEMSQEKRQTYMRGQNISIAVLKASENVPQIRVKSVSLRASHKFLDYSWVKSSDEMQNYCKDLEELKDGDVCDVEEPPQQLSPEKLPGPTISPSQSLADVSRAGFASGGMVQPLPTIDDSASNTVVFKLKPNQELRFEVKADSNQQARKTTATLVLQQPGRAEICGAELAAGREYVQTHTEESRFPVCHILSQVRFSTCGINRRIHLPRLHAFPLWLLSRGRA